MTKSIERSSIAPRQVGQVKMSAEDVADYAAKRNRYQSPKKPSC